MQEMFTKDITLILYIEKIPGEYKEELSEKNISVITGWPIRIIGEDKIEALELKDKKTIPCEAVMSHFGYKLNDEFLLELGLKKDSEGFKYIVNSNYESSLSGLYIVGPLNQGHDQAVIAAGEGAVAAIDIKKRMLEIF